MLKPLQESEDLTFHSRVPQTCKPSHEGASPPPASGRQSPDNPKSGNKLRTMTRMPISQGSTRPPWTGSGLTMHDARETTASDCARRQPRRPAAEPNFGPLWKGLTNRSSRTQPSMLSSPGSSEFPSPCACPTGTLSCSPHCRHPTLWAVARRGLNPVCHTRRTESRRERPLGSSQQARVCPPPFPRRWGPNRASVRPRAARICIGGSSACNLQPKTGQGRESCVWGWSWCKSIPSEPGNLFLCLLLHFVCSNELLHPPAARLGQVSSAQSILHYTRLNERASRQPR